ncbi:MAG: ABC transporter substrate-binding protein [Deltaproteobacteria bacterium]|nr:ABC transporter substrate-binding protein [Deltaproteobacteria bacterium]
MRRALPLALLLAAAPAAGAPRARPCAEIRLLLPAAPAALDPALLHGSADLLAARALHAGILEPGPGGSAAPALAEEPPQVSADGRLVRLRLRAGLRFHDGAPVTAADAVESLSRLLRPETRSPHGWIAAPIEGAEEVRAGRARVPSGLSAPSPLELEIRLTEPAPAFLRGLAAPPAAVVHAGSLAGAGPYRPAARAADALRLAAFPGHFRGRPWCEALALAWPEPAAAARRLARGEAEVAVRPEAFPGHAPRELPLATAVVVQVRAQRLGTSAEPVRRALLALDRAELARLLRGPARPLASLDPSAPAAPAPAAPPTGPLPPRLGLLAPASLRALADRIQVKLFDRGVRVAVEAVPDAAFAARLEAGLHELALVPAALASDDPALALAQLATALGGPARGDQVLRDAARLGPAAAAAAAEAELGAVPLALAWLRISAAPGLQGLAPAPDGTFDPGGLWLLPAASEGRAGP